MDICEPVDDRASVTLDRMITPYLNSILDSTSVKEIISAIITHLPPSIAHGVELRFRLFIMKEHNFNTQRLYVIELAHKLITARICKFFFDANVNLFNPMFTQNKNTRKDKNNVVYGDIVGDPRKIFSREDVIKWFRSIPDCDKYLTIPTDEIITVEVKFGDHFNSNSLILTEDQIIGIAYGLNGIGKDNIILKSSITNNIISITNIIEHSLIYKLKILLATEKLKRPYQVDILQNNNKLQSGQIGNNSYITIHFSNPEFMQGLLSVARWYQLPGDGKEILWKNLCKFTPGGNIPLKL